MTEIIITIAGGTLQHVHSNSSEVKVILIDYDNIRYAKTHEEEQTYKEKVIEHEKKRNSSDFVQLQIQ